LTRAIAVVVAMWGCSSAPTPAPAREPLARADAAPSATAPIDAMAAPPDARAADPRPAAAQPVDAGTRCPIRCIDLCCEHGEACSHGDGTDGITPKCVRPRRR
jgi:hypothetical protein